MVVWIGLGWFGLAVRGMMDRGGGVGFGRWGQGGKMVASVCERFLACMPDGWLMGSYVSSVYII